jgi:hypothetical protein
MVAEGDAHCLTAQRGGKSKQVIDHLPIQNGSLGDWSGGVAYIDDPEPSKRGQGHLLTRGSPLKPPCLLPNKATALGLGSMGCFQSCKMLDPQGACKFPVASFSKMREANCLSGQES